MKNSGLSASQIDEVILVGGSTRIPKVQDEVEKLFGRKPSKAVNPDEAVAVGAAIQGGVLTGEVKDVLLLDVIPLSLGIETMGGVFTRMVEANTTIPSKKVETYSTASDNQPSVEINILQGERPMAQQNRQLGRFILSDIPPAPRGVPQIEVTFDVDANGILHVTAKDKGTGKEQKIRIEASSGLTDAEINRMREEAKANEATDKAERETIEKVNAADSMIFQTEKQLKEYGDKLTPPNKTAIEDALGTLRTAHASRDAAAIDTALDALNAAWATASTEMYNTTGAEDSNPNPMDGAGFDGGNANPGNGQGQPAGDNVSDVPYEEVK